MRSQPATGVLGGRSAGARSWRARGKGVRTFPTFNIVCNILLCVHIIITPSRSAEQQSRMKRRLASHEKEEPAPEKAATSGEVSSLPVNDETKLQKIVTRTLVSKCSDDSSACVTGGNMLLICRLPATHAGWLCHGDCLCTHSPGRSAVLHYFRHCYPSGVVSRAR